MKIFPLDRRRVGNWHHARTEHSEKQETPSGRHTHELKKAPCTSPPPFLRHDDAKEGLDGGTGGVLYGGGGQCRRHD